MIEDHWLFTNIFLWNLDISDELSHTLSDLSKYTHTRILLTHTLRQAIFWALIQDHQIPRDKSHHIPDFLKIYNSDALISKGELAWQKLWKLCKMIHWFLEGLDQERILRRNCWLSIG